MSVNKFHYTWGGWRSYSLWDDRLLAKDSEVRGKPLQLGRTYDRRTTR